MPKAAKNAGGDRKAVLVYTTVGSEAAAKALARTLLDARLIACANLFPIRSLYRWKGAIHDEGEVALLLKTVRDRVDDLFEKLRDVHPYEVPCIEAYPAEAVHEPFAAWLRDETRSQPAARAKPRAR